MTTKPETYRTAANVIFGIAIAMLVADLALLLKLTTLGGLFKTRELSLLSFVLLMLSRGLRNEGKRAARVTTPTAAG